MSSKKSASLKKLMDQFKKTMKNDPEKKAARHNFLSSQSSKLEQSKSALKDDMARVKKLDISFKRKKKTGNPTMSRERDERNRIMDVYESFTPAERKLWHDRKFDNMDLDIYDFAKELKLKKPQKMKDVVITPKMKKLDISLETKKATKSRKSLKDDIAKMIDIDTKMKKISDAKCQKELKKHVKKIAELEEKVRKLNKREPLKVRF